MNNPEFLKIQKPTRESDCDKHLGVSSAQVFEGIPHLYTEIQYMTHTNIMTNSGEDLSGKERLTAQQKQRADWATAQKDERNRAEQLLRYSDYLYEVVYYL